MKQFDMAQNCPLWKTDVYVWSYAPLEVHVRNEDYLQWSLIWSQNRAI